MVAIALIGFGCGGAEKERVGTSADAAAGGDAATRGDAGTDASTDPGFRTPDVEPVCTDGTAWAEGETAFRDATSEWGLDELGAQGVLVQSTDIDGDGWPDLFVRRSVTTLTVFGDGEEAETHAWLLRNDGEGGFIDVTFESGLLATRSGYPRDFARPAHVVAWADVDNDGDIDAYTGHNEGFEVPVRETSEIMKNAGDGFFAFGPADSELRRIDQTDTPAGAAFVDVDLDGVLDLWTARNDGGLGPGQDLLFLGDGTGAFRDVTEDAGLTTTGWTDAAALNAARAHTAAWSALACDLDGDMVPELLSASYGRTPNHLWRGSLTGETFAATNHSVASGYAFDHRMDWTDNESARCHCKLNPDAPDCAGVPEPELIRCNGPSDVFRWRHQFDREPFRLGGNSGSTACADVDNDGHFDLLTSEIVHWDVGSSSDPSELLFQDGEADLVFERPGPVATGLTRTDPMVAWNHGDITSNLFDFDNDGWTDVYIGATDYPGNRGLLYRQVAPRQFVEVPTDDWVEHNRSHGVTVADFDRDGDLDLVVGHSRFRCDADEPNNCYPTAQVRLLENVLGDGGNWLQLDLVGGEGTNRGAVGARVEVTTDGTTQSQQEGGGFGHYGAQNDPVLHFGLGAACEATVTVRWPDAARSQETATLPAGHRYRWEQGVGITVVE